MQRLWVSFIGINLFTIICMGSYFIKELKIRTLGPQREWHSSILGTYLWFSLIFLAHACSVLECYFFIIKFSNNIDINWYLLGTVLRQTPAIGCVSKKARISLSNYRYRTFTVLIFDNLRIFNLRLQLSRRLREGLFV